MPYSKKFKKIAPSNAERIRQEGRSEDSPCNSTEARMETLMHKPKHKSHLRKMIADEQKGIREYSKILSDEKKHLKALKKQLKRHA